MYYEFMWINWSLQNIFFSNRIDWFFWAFKKYYFFRNFWCNCLNQIATREYPRSLYMFYFYEGPLYEYWFQSRFSKLFSKNESVWLKTGYLLEYSRAKKRLQLVFSKFTAVVVIESLKFSPSLIKDMYDRLALISVNK